MPLGMTAPPVLCLTDVHKAYAGRPAVRGVSFTIPGGGITGILGPNGAGKSSLLKMILGILGPDDGSIALWGKAPEIGGLAKVGYLPEERGLYRKMKCAEIIAYFAQLKGVPAGEAKKRARALLETHGLGAWADRPVKQLSKGMAQKVQILACVAHEPDLIILDEPFSGLDPVNQATVETLVTDLAAAGKTVLFSTHVMEHAERLCDRIILIGRGRKLFDGPVSDALGLVPRSAIVDVDQGFDAVGTLASRGFRAEAIEGGEDGAARVRLALSDASEGRRALTALLEAGAPLRQFEPNRPHLRDAFVQLVNAAEAV